jgi:hypothetical protein
MIFVAVDSYTFLLPAASLVDSGIYWPPVGSDLMWADDGLARHDVSGEFDDGCPFEVPAAGILSRSAFSR